MSSFLDALDRVTSPRYIPSDGNVLHTVCNVRDILFHFLICRRHPPRAFKNLRRYRIQLYTPILLALDPSHFSVMRLTSAAGTLSMVPSEWRIFDVGGQRSLVSPPSLFSSPCRQLTYCISTARYGLNRLHLASPASALHSFLAAWVPFFDDMNAIIFLAPISCFDQTLAEDDSVNRLVRHGCFLVIISVLIDFIMNICIGGFGAPLEIRRSESLAETHQPCAIPKQV